MTTESRMTTGRGERYDSILDTIGNTPAVRLNKIAPEHVNLYVKAEFFNPASSIKDRLAISIIEEAERSGALKPGQTVVEASSGNTGLGLAMVCAAKGYRCIIVMPQVPPMFERYIICRQFGAEARLLTLTTNH